ncbi:o-succinylbenzoate--CoA ligase [Cellulomonas massiliensis]|uniref:o-succinylbenzoate--CoA ligase n=1 Tax=Cellulomonas massiliensis TaxID=1465811 RepID=UPI000361E9BD|nr:o-succinylbenzoate--CoA ligase [Cellulomonas massiliensis]
MDRSVRVLPARLDRVDEVRAAVATALGGDAPLELVAPTGSAADASAPPLRVPAGTALVVRTSGSTGEPQPVALGAHALRASAAATAARLGGGGRWLLALPLEHVAGAQVMVRSVLAGTVPVVLEPPFRPDRFVAATARLGAGRRLTSLVPTQLARLLGDPDAVAALRTFDAVLVGGAATPGPLLDALRAAGVRLVTTYGMTETCGGCVYDGVPLDGVRVRVDDDGRVLLTGDVLASGHVGRPDLDDEAFVRLDGERWLRTRDRGSWAGGRLAVHGRLDDVLVTGGEKVAPAAVEDVLASVPGVTESCVVGVPDDEWGQAVVAVVVPGAAEPDEDALRAAVRERLGRAAVPRRVVLVDALPLRPSGKVDRTAAARLAARAAAAPVPSSSPGGSTRNPTADPTPTDGSPT